MRVGIPRGLLYYQYYPMWRAFLEGVGAEVVTSPRTTKETVDHGCSRVVGDVCLPAKVFCGHVRALSGECDSLFIPSVRSVKHGVNSCPKFIGLPDLVKAAVRGCPPIIDPDVDVARRNDDMSGSLFHVGRMLSDDRWKIESAVRKALEAHRRYRLMMRQGLPSPAALAEVFPSDGDKAGTGTGGSAPAMAVALVGHPYLLYDEYLNHGLVSRLERMGVRAVFPEMIGEKDLDASLAELVGEQYWSYEEEVIGAGGHHLHSGVSGIIAVVAFGCGPDSVMIEVLRRRAAETGKPFLNLVVDEHTAEGGMVTRVETFVDMIRQRMRVGWSAPREKSRRVEEVRGIRALGLPNFANIAPAFRGPVAMLGVKLIAPPVTRNTIALGTKYSPEFVCLPFKMILGSFVEALQQGADTLFMITSSDACRMGYYAKLQEQILRDLGFHFDFLRYRSQRKGLLSVLSAVREYANGSPWSTVIAAYRLGIAKLKALDDLQRHSYKVRAVEMEKGKTDRIYRDAVRAVDEVTGLSGLRDTVRQYRDRMERVPIDPKTVPLRVGIVGELYVVMEPLVNMDLEVELGRRGVEVRRTRTTFFSEYTGLASYLNVLDSEKKKLRKFARPYLARDVGGHGLESVGEKVRLAREGYDGIVHVMPFTCMPEAIAQNVMLGTEEDIPVLSVVCDEQMEQGGLLTRIEAFVDTMEWRRRSRGKAVMSRSALPTHIRL